MEKSRLCSVWWTGVISLAAGVVMCAAPLLAYEVLTPPLEAKNQVNSRRAQSHLIIKASGKEEAGQLRVVRLAGSEGESKSQAVKPLGSWEKDGAVFLHYSLELRKGANTFGINPGAKELAISYQPQRTMVKVDADDPTVMHFHRSETVPAVCGGCHTDQLPADSGLNVQQLRKNSDFSPLCFSCHRRLASGSKWLHAPTALVACMTCHRRSEGSDKIATQVGQVAEACFSCHISKRRWNTSPFVHSQVANGDCTVCHDPHGADYPYMLWADPKIDICIACHAEMEDIRKNKRGYVAHGILEGSGCSACHSPHASDYRFQLAGPINDVCVSCHVTFKGIKEGHPVGKHPLSGVPDQLRKGRELACSGCHNPHGSEYKFLLIGNLLGGHVCTKCHK